VCCNACIHKFPFPPPPFLLAPGVYEQVMVVDVVTKSIIAHFRAHTSALAVVASRALGDAAGDCLRVRTLP